MIEDMSVRGFKEDTRRDYVRHVRAFAAFIGRSPDTATAEELRPFTTNIDPGDAAPAERRPSAPVFALDILAPAAARHARARRERIQPSSSRPPPRRGMPWWGEAP